MARRFRQVDVFAETPYAGNPVAVVLDAEGIADDERARFSRWTNLSETTFVLPPTEPDADYRVRIFSLDLELPFAGHPTLGTCHAWLEAGGKPKQADVVVQECGAGLVRVRRDAGRLAFAAPPLVRSGPAEEELVRHVADVLGIRREEIVDAAWADNGPGWVAVLLASPAAVLAVRPGRLDLDLGVVALDADGSLEVRAFFPKDGAAAEDPVTGSLNASVAQWLFETGRLSAPYVARQGTGRVHVTQDADGTVWVGGGTFTCIAGEVEL